jgi:hypothetical protein
LRRRSIISAHGSDAAPMRDDQVRLYGSSIIAIVENAFRRPGLAGTEMAKTQIG